MKDQTSNLLVIAIIGVAVTGLGTYLFWQEAPLADETYSPFVAPDGAYVFEEKSVADYSYQDKARYEQEIVSQIRDLKATLAEQSEAIAGPNAKLRFDIEQDLETLRLQLAQARAASEHDWQRLKTEISTTYDRAEKNIATLSH